ncbi:MAG: monovalent cation:proton antiporter-2 (CPA2) family protein [Bacteroidota bacterium]
MHQQDFFHQALVYLLAAVISVPVAKRLGFGSVLGYLLAGVVIGPFLLGLIGSEGEDVMHFAEFGVVMMLFLIGMELKPNLLWEMRKSIFGLGGLQLLVTTLFIGGIAILLGRTAREGIGIGLMLALSSTAIVLQTLAEKGIMKQASGQASFSVLLFQDMAVIPILALLPLLGAADAVTSAIHNDEVRQIAGMEVSGWFQVGMILVVITGIVIAGRYLARFIFRIIARTGLREIFTATALLLVISIAILMDLVGLSPALGAFLAGVVLANNEYRHELEADIEPFKGLLLGLFFISVGAGIDFNLLVSKPGIILGFLFLLIAIKFIILFILGRIFGIRGGQNTLFAFSLAQGGEFAFVLISFSMYNGVVSSDISDLLFLVVALSMAITPLLLVLNDRVILPLVFRSENLREDDPIEESGNPVVIAGFGRFGEVMGRFLIANGFKATILDDNPDNIQVLRKFGFNVYYGDATRPDLLAAAGCGEAKVIVVAVNEKQKSLKIIDLVQRKYPQLKILARSTDMDHTYELMDRGVEEFKRDTFESSLKLGVMAITQLGINKYRAHRLAQTFRQHNRSVIQDLYKHHKEDEKKYLSEAKKHASELEELFRTENEESDHHKDCSWDVTTRRDEVRQIRDEMDQEENKE